MNLAKSSSPNVAPAALSLAACGGGLRGGGDVCAPAAAVDRPGGSLHGSSAAVAIDDATRNIGAKTWLCRSARRLQGSTTGVFTTVCCSAAGVDRLAVDSRGASKAGVACKGASSTGRIAAGAARLPGSATACEVRATGAARESADPGPPVLPRHPPEAAHRVVRGGRRCRRGAGGGAGGENPHLQGQGRADAAAPREARGASGGAGGGAGGCRTPRRRAARRRFLSLCTRHPSCHAGSKGPHASPGPAGGGERGIGGGGSVGGGRGTRPLRPCASRPGRQRGRHAGRGDERAQRRQARRGGRLAARIAGWELRGSVEKRAASESPPGRPGGGAGSDA